MPSIDFTQVPDLDPIPTGEYGAQIVNAEVKMSKSGHPMINLRWEVEHEGAKRIVFDSLSFHPNALWRTKAVLRSLGFDRDFQGEIEPEDLIGRDATISVALETGRTNPETGEEYPDRNRVVKVSASDAATPW